MNVYLAHGAEASLSMADANLEGVKPFDHNKINTHDQIITIGVCAVAASSLLTGLFAMYIEASIIAYFAFAFPLITGPMVISQRRKIQWIPSK
jgi:Mg2+ and Co2+ transporter CorA